MWYHLVRNSPTNPLLHYQASHGSPTPPAHPPLSPIKTISEWISGAQLLAPLTGTFAENPTRLSAVGNMALSRIMADNVEVDRTRIISLCFYRAIKAERDYSRLVNLCKICQLFQNMHVALRAYFGTNTTVFKCVENWLEKIDH